MLLEGGIALSEACGIAQRLSRDHVDHPTDGIRAEESRATTTHHLDTLDHRGRDLLQPVDTSQRAEDRTAINKDLRIGSLQTIDTDLVEATVLAVVLDTKSWLEAQALAEVIRIGLLEDLLREDGDKARCMTAKRLLTISRDDDPIEVNTLLLQVEIEVAAMPSFDTDTALLDTIAHETCYDGIGAGSKTLDGECSMDIGRRANSRPLDENLDVRKGFVSRSVDDGTHDTPRSR